ncbi:hypothetical protein CDAR_105041 [Caerostris darwini]|uniref:Uncharacterized protein n=1 Tax=Caerostris darwini TaxID=1538125 RepID=A0AAV4V709_9ARAC|nr:hypothetical protein CDAR_105041 [Caerostris darwini]
MFLLEKYILAASKREPRFKTSSNTGGGGRQSSILHPPPFFLFTNPKDTSSNSPGLQIEFNVNRVRRMARQLFTAEAHGRILIAGSSNLEFLFHCNPELKVQNPSAATPLQCPPFSSISSLFGVLRGGGGGTRRWRGFK